MKQIKTIKQWLASLLTVFVIGTLFGVIFIRTEIVQPTPEFFLELTIVLGLTLMMKIWWYDFAEDKRLNDDDIKKAQEDYFTMVDKHITDSNDLEQYLAMLNQENKDHYVANKMGCRTAKNLAKKNWWIHLWHPSWKKLTKEEIGQLRYSKLYFKYQRRADKIRPIKSEEIIALADSKVLYDSKNHRNEKKRIYQTVTTIISFMLTTILASLAMKELMLNWENVFRYVGYLCAMIWTVATTILKAYRQTGTETFDYYNRLRFIVDKYVTYKKKEVANNNE